MRNKKSILTITMAAIAVIVVTSVIENKQIFADKPADLYVTTGSDYLISEMDGIKKDKIKDCKSEVFIPLNIKKLYPIIDSAILTMSENGYKFNPKNHQFSWSVIYYYVNNYSYKKDIKTKKDRLVIKEKNVKAKLKCFSASKSKIPSSMSNIIEKKGNKYLFRQSDRGTNTKVTKVKKIGNTYKITVTVIKYPIKDKKEQYSVSVKKNKIISIKKVKNS